METLMIQSSSLVPKLIFQIFGFRVEIGAQSGGFKSLVSIPMIRDNNAE